MDLELNVFSLCVCQMLLVQYLQKDQQVLAHQFLLSHSLSQQIHYVSAKVYSISHKKCTMDLLYLWLRTSDIFLHNLGKKQKNREPADTFEKLMAFEQIADKREEEWMKWQLEFWEKMGEKRQKREQEREHRILGMLFSFMQQGPSSHHPPYGAYDNYVMPQYSPLHPSSYPYSQPQPPA